MFKHHLQNDEINIVPARNKKTGKVEILVIAEEITDDEDEFYIVPLGKLYELGEEVFKKYDFDVNIVESDVIYERKPWWKFWGTA